MHLIKLQRLTRQQQQPIMSIWLGTTCYLEEVMMVPKHLLLRIQGDARAPPCTCLRAPILACEKSPRQWHFMRPAYAVIST